MSLPSINANRFRIALGALAEMVNEQGHTTLCWDARQLGIKECSDACRMARIALSIENLTEPKEILDRLNQLKLDSDKLREKGR